jgi:hypothetical protein
LNSGTLRANNWILTLSPGENVREVDSENERGASFAGAAAQTSSIDSETSSLRKVMRFLEECSNGLRQENSDCSRPASTRLRMVNQFRQGHAPQFTWSAMVRARVINNLRIHTNPRDDHGMPRRRMAELAIEQQVAG